MRTIPRFLLAAFLLTILVALSCVVAASRIDEEASPSTNPTRVSPVLVNKPDIERLHIAGAKRSAHMSSDDDRSPFRRAKEVLTWLALFGAFGGALATLSEVPIQQILKEGSKAYGTPGRLFWGMLVGGAWGTGAAVSFSIFLVLDQHISDSRFQMAETKILLAGTGVAAGFAGIRLLKLVGGRLERQVGEIVDKKTATLESTTETKLEQNKDAGALLAEALSTASSVLAVPDADRTADPKRRAAIDHLERARVVFPTLRSVAIYLGRLYKGLTDYRGGVQVHTEFLGVRRKAGIEMNKDDAALLYNRACYAALAAANAADRDELYRQALSDLAQSVKLAPENAAAAAEDPDFTQLRKDRSDEMKKLSSGS